MNSYKDSKIYRKSEEIFSTLRIITDLIPEENSHLVMLKEQLLTDMMTIQAKLAGAFSVDLYDIKMENATFIRKAAKDLLVSYHSLKLFGFEDVEYYKLVRNQIEEFRFLFVEWVQNFNKKHYITDQWGLFNPPGISFDDEQRSDELNFLDDNE